MPDSSQMFGKSSGGTLDFFMCCDKLKTFYAINNCITDVIYDAYMLRIRFFYTLEIK